MKELLSQQQLSQGVDRLAQRIGADYAGRPLTVVGVLSGCIMLLADLIRRLDLPLCVGLVQARSYRGDATRPGELTIAADLLPDVRGHDVLLVDDIFDTGHTLMALVEQASQWGAASVRSAVLLRKLGRQETKFVPDYIAFDIPDVFVVGYGMDYNDRYRNLPYVAALESCDLVAEPASGAAAKPLPGPVA